MSGRKLLCLCDSPTLETGFARVSRNLISRWLKSGFFEQIWVWGIGFNGFPHRVAGLENRICPASQIGFPSWYEDQNLKVFARMISDQDVGNTQGGFTHLWMLQDTFLLCNHAGAIRQACIKNGVASYLYFPVDAPLMPQWTTIMAGVDTVVAYCEYGRNEAVSALRQPMLTPKYEQQLDSVNLQLKTCGRRDGQKQANLLQRRQLLAEEIHNLKATDALRKDKANHIHVLPHGVDKDVYFTLSQTERLDTRKKLFHGHVLPTDFLIVNVSQHQKRKGVAQSLLLLRDIKAMRPELSAKMYLHLESRNPNEGTDLLEVARQLGLTEGELFFGDNAFIKGLATTSEGTLNKIYNTADLVINTGFGEGWGLPLTEAMAAGVAVAGPRHTSVAELLGEQRGILFDTLGWDVIVHDNSRVRPRCDTNDAARRIISSAEASPDSSHSIAAYAKRGMDWARSDFLDWDRIADEWTKFFKGIAQ